MTAVDKLAKQVAGLVVEVSETPRSIAMMLVVDRAVSSGMWALTLPRNYTRLVNAKRELEDVL